MKEGDGWDMHVKQSSSTKSKWKGEQLKRKKGHMKLYSYTSQALIRWQILFWMMIWSFCQSEKKGLMYLILWTIGRKLQSSVTYLEYLTHSETHYFSAISIVFSWFRWPGPFSKKSLGTLHQFWEWNMSEGCAHVRVTIKAKLRVVLWRKKVRSVGWLCVSKLKVKKIWGGIITAKPKSKA